MLSVRVLAGMLHVFKRQKWITGSLFYIKESYRESIVTSVSQYVIYCEKMYCSAPTNTI